jgi:sugar lactone lactonase YvrE
MRLRPSLSALLLGAAVGCATRAADPLDVPAAAAATAADTARLITTVDGFTGPEAVRYDPDQDLYFVSNFGTGSATARDTNGFISRVRSDGSIESLRWIAGNASGVVLHAPRGMYVVGDTLWVADADAVRGFHRRTGAPLRQVDFAGQDVGFLNDVAASPDGRVYVTDTGKHRIYRVAGDVTIALGDSALGAPNGITWDAANRRFLVVPYGGGKAVRAWMPESATLTDVGTSAGGRFDGVEALADGRIVVASQADSSIHVFTGGTGRPVIRVAGRPADIAVDTRRNRVAIPYIALNRVEIWQLPAR